MDHKALELRIRNALAKNPDDTVIYDDYLSLCRDAVDTGLFTEAHDWNHGLLRWHIIQGLRRSAEAGDYEKADRFDQLLFRSLLFGARDFFDDYLQAVEYGKPYDKKFYAPRRVYLKRYVDAYQEVLEGKLDFLSISMPKRAGKAVTLDTMIPTPFGFKRMGDIKVGDLVMASDGYDTKVTDVFPQGKVPVYKVCFSDGSSVKTCGNHLWEVKYHNVNAPSGHRGYSTRVVSTAEMLKEGITGGKGRGKHNVFSVKYAQPAEFLYKEVELDPYVLGALLGDGSMSEPCITITNPDHEVTDYMCANLPKGDEMYDQDAVKHRWLIRAKKRGQKSRTAQILENMGLLGTHSWDKFIPNEYLYTTSTMRWELLMGLLDTDGFAETKGIEYSTTSPRLRDGVCFLVRSLGGYCSYSQRMGRYRKDGVVVETRMNYRLHICFPAGTKPFRIARKAEKYNPKRETLYRYITSITPCGEEEAQCICVDHPDHLFLVTDYFIPTHNSQMGINFINMLSGRNPDRSTLAEGTGDALVNSFYQGCLEYLVQPSDYHFYDIFPEAKLVQTNADTKIINLQHRSRFPTIMCRSIDARQVGLSEATNILYLDDTVEGREEAKNRQRLDDKWEVISGDILGRAIEGTPIVICGTRYSIYDPIGRLQETMKEQGKRMKILETPALDLETDESNFEYEREGRKVFTTQYFRDQREMLSEEQWESEFQQQPFEAKGLMFPKGRLNYFFELPVDREPDAVIAACDTAESGEDYCSMPIGMIYGEDVFIPDVVFDNSPAEVTKPECANTLKRWNVATVRFESNNAGSYFARDVDTLMQSQGYYMSVQTRRSISNKVTRIEFASDNIIKHFWFLHPSKYARNSQYAEFMKNVTTMTRSGKIPHDDGPDSLAMLEGMVRSMSGGKAEPTARLW